MSWMQDLIRQLVTRESEKLIKHWTNQQKTYLSRKWLCCFLKDGQKFRGLVRNRK
jgi:hypothetical protein